MGNLSSQTTELEADVEEAIKAGNLPQLRWMNISAKESVMLTDRKSFLSRQVHTAVEKGQIACLDYLLQNGADPSLPIGVDQNSPLHKATAKAKMSALESCKLLLKAKADINAQNVWKRTPVITAIINFKTALAQFLMDENADLNIPDENGTTPLMVCASYGNLSLLRSVISKGANINGRDRQGRTALHFAVVGMHVDIIKELISKKCLLNTYDVLGNSPLHVAITKCNTQIVDILIEGGTHVVPTEAHIMDLCIKIVQSTVTRSMVYPAASHTDQAISSLECMVQVLVAMGNPLKKSVSTKLGRLEKLLPAVESVPDGAQKVFQLFHKVLALVNAVTAQKPVIMDSLQNLSRIACRRSMMVSGHNVTWAVKRLDIHKFLKNFITLKD